MTKLRTFDRWWRSWLCYAVVVANCVALIVGYTANLPVLIVVGWILVGVTGAVTVGYAVAIGRLLRIQRRKRLARRARWSATDGRG